MGEGDAGAAAGGEGDVVTEARVRMEDDPSAAVSKDEPPAAGQGARELDADSETRECDQRQRSDPRYRRCNAGAADAELVHPKRDDGDHAEHSAATTVHFYVLSHPLEKFPE
jgi:hypothetical protein